ncbi:NAD-dependent epimerase/dehydratase family protein [Planosporangium thailandense]|uniref:NAD-dependent epimerase/dehydratase family protein n=1 Tax=Planosporangium thailandense TaxID=765197 RepID=A0ABX0Y6I9_9ACTN|nr:NAD-dependent epimerase/dehydratase family protein [Planosporangium thailandense]NJC73032.1 NAD-dependent epimerase/dehydratase family protein [Planosporangium thailandense]
MRLLVLGGSWFVGRVLVAEAVQRGHDVTVFNRGASPAHLPSAVRHVRGDRELIDDVRALARCGPWDVVVDVAGSVPAVVRRSVEILADVAQRCVFVSTISAYRDWPHAPVDEDSALWDGDPDFDPGTRRWDPDAYGPLKVGCEIASRDAFGPERLLVLRPHVVLGPHEYVGRLPWWLTRMRRGGPVLAPAPDRGIQPVDVRDLTGFLLDQAEWRGTGVFNVAPPATRATYGDMLRSCIEVTADVAERSARLVWVDECWLVEQGVTQWTELPLWRSAAAPWGMNADRARRAGLRCRPLAETVADTWTWLCEGGRPVTHERFAEHGIAPEREASLIARWLAEHPRQSDGASEPAPSRTPG